MSGRPTFTAGPGSARAIPQEGAQPRQTQGGVQRVCGSCHLLFWRCGGEEWDSNRASPLFS